jgi:hypothetical protein
MWHLMDIRQTLEFFWHFLVGADVHHCLWLRGQCFVSLPKTSKGLCAVGLEVIPRIASTYPLLVSCCIGWWQQASTTKHSQLSPNCTSLCWSLEQSIHWNPGDVHAWHLLMALSYSDLRAASQLTSVGEEKADVASKWNPKWYSHKFQWSVSLYETNSSLPNRWCACSSTAPFQPVKWSNLRSLKASFAADVGTGEEMVERVRWRTLQGMPYDVSSTHDWRISIRCHWKDMPFQFTRQSIAD